MPIWRKPRVIEFQEFELPIEAARRATVAGRHTPGLTKPLDRTEAWLGQCCGRFVAKIPLAGPDVSTTLSRCPTTAS